MLRHDMHIRGYPFLYQNTLKYKLYTYHVLEKDWKILSIMSARRADEVTRDKMAEEAHRQWEAEKNRRIRESQAHELHHWQTLAHNKRKQEQQKVRTFALLM